MSRAAQLTAPVRIAVDVGGTFTDVVAVRGDAVVVQLKVPSTPPDYSDGIVRGTVLALERSGATAADVDLILHGTTVATNAILERRGARAALITTKGFRDVLELRRFRRPSLFDMSWDKPESLIPRWLTFEVDERIDASGQVLRSVDRDAVAAVLREIEQLDVDSVAICLLNSYANDAHERELVELVRNAGTARHVSASYDVSPEIREYERTSTTAINAYLQPAVASYVGELRGRLNRNAIDAPVRIMRSDGGMSDAEQASQLPASIVESGPAAGVIAAAALARTLGIDRAIAFDMGGTTAKASLIENGLPLESAEYEVGAGLNASRGLVGGGGAGHVLRLPSLDISEVGAGGGSIVWFDALGTPHIGPESAGATPGPVCYGRGGERPTVTDANAVLGYLSPQALAGGIQEMHLEPARRALQEQVAAPLKREAQEAAYGVHLLANAAMSRAIRSVTTERGRDPRECVLIAYGGAGPLHAVEIAREFGITRVVVPVGPGVFSATGLLLAEVSFEQAATVGTSLADAAAASETLNARLDALEHAALERAAADGYGAKELALQRVAETRYVGQSFALRIPVPLGRLDATQLASVRAAFDAEHERSYGRAAPDEDVEIVNLRVRATRKDGVEALRPPSDALEAGGEPGRRVAFFGEAGALETPIVRRGHLRDGALEGPVIVEDADATTAVPPGARVALGEHGELLIDPITPSSESRADHRVAAAGGDPITREIVRNALTSIADEMALTVIRTAHSAVVRESLDFSSVLFGPGGEVLAQGSTLPLHLGAMPDAMAALLGRYGDDINRGDVFILNDPDEGGMHLPDVFLFQPIFDGEQRVGFSGVAAHQADIGGRAPGGNAPDSKEIFEEGLQIPLLKLFDRGRENEAILALLARNVRLPEMVLGDLRAQLAAGHIAERRLLELVERYGRAVLLGYMDEVLDTTEAWVRREIASIPDGSYAFVDRIDDDGFGSGTIEIAVGIEIAGDTIAFDFAGTSPQVRSALNGTMSIVKAAVYAALMAVMDTSVGLGCNDGFARPIGVTAPVGTILNPRRPAARAARGLTAFRVVDAVLGALHQAVPGRVPAAGDGGLTVVAFGASAEDGRSLILTDGLASGWGGRWDKDGIDGISSLAANLASTPVEVVEASFPILIEEYGFLPDSEGPGRFRGCLSTVRQFRLLADDGEVQIRSDRSQNLPYGLEGGLPGTPSQAILNPGPDEHPLPAKGTRRIRGGDVLRVISPGGGGYGPPCERDPAAVARDVADGKITPEHAERVYGWSLPPEITNPETRNLPGGAK